MRIALCGTIGVGKSTLISVLAEEELFKGYAIYKEFPVGLKGTPGSAHWTNCLQKKLEAGYIFRNVLGDRYFVDRLAWELMHPVDDLRQHYALCDQAIYYMYKYLPETLLCYIPIEFPLSAEELIKRPDRDPTIRENFDAKIQETLQFFKLPHLVLRGSVEQRKSLVLESVIDGKLLGSRSS